MSDNLYCLLEAGIRRDPGAPCLHLPDGRILTYRDLEHGAARIAAYLVQQHVEPGDRVLVNAPKTPAFVMLYLAVLKIGAVFTPVNPDYTGTEIDQFVADCKPCLIIEDCDAILTKSPTALREIVTPRTARDLAALIYTSGTTGKPKGVMLSHGALAANARTLAETWEFSSDDVLIHALPVFHVHGLFVALHCALLFGGAIVWLPRFDDQAILASMSRATVLMGVPTFYTRLLASDHLTREACAGMRLFISGSAPLHVSTFASWEERTGHRILERYGMSEAAIITSNPLNGDRIAGSVGYPLPHTEVMVDSDASGNAGVLAIRSPSLFNGYWRMSQQTAESFNDQGYFITGDIASIDEGGRVWIKGRAKDLIISGGFNVYPKEIELVLDALAGVEESAVIGVPHHDFGETVCAVIVGTSSPADLIAETRKVLAPYKVPRQIEFIDKLPRNAMGKVQKDVLRRTYSAPAT
jgi:malonyl-CoA/methylmalonyl-CoA synthetase